MKDYIIMTDSGCDLGIDILNGYGVECSDLTFRSADDTHVTYNRHIPVSQFYSSMRKGTVFQTSAVNCAEYLDAFRKNLEAGRDIIYIGLSSGLSTTVNTASLAAGELAAEYPERRITVIDSLCGSAGLGLLIYYAVQKKREGINMQELSDYIYSTAPRICHWVTVDDLKYLKRGGRLSAAGAFAASILNIKPVIHMNDEGKLISMSRTRGRKQVIKELAGKYLQLSDDPEHETYFISHGDCFEDAGLLEEMIFKECGVRATLITDIGPVIGAHSGPGTLALFFKGKYR